MNLCLQQIDGAKVVRWIELDQRKHQKTDAIRLYSDGAEQREFFGLAIATYEPPDATRRAHYLFYCDADWETLNDSLYASLDEALDEAHRQFSVERNDWRLISTEPSRAEQDGAGQPPTRRELE